jgi:hypothetical protein
VTATETNVLTLDELLVKVRELAAATLHGPDCSISPDDTDCQCLIGDLQAALPRCAYSITLAGQPGWLYRCVSIAHPDRPSLHFLKAIS